MHWLPSKQGLLVIATAAVAAAPFEQLNFLSFALQLVCCNNSPALLLCGVSTTENQHPKNKCQTQASLQSLLYIAVSWLFNEPLISIMLLSSAELAYFRA